MTYEDFFPLVMPSVSACPASLAEQHIRNAAIEFCDRTHVWAEDLDTLLSDGLTGKFPLALDDQVELAKLLTVIVVDPGAPRGVEYDPIDSRAGRRLANNGTNKNVVWTDDQRSITLLPAPIDGAQVRVYAALKPSMQSFEFPNDLYGQYATQIAKGALASLLDIPGSDWRDSGSAGIKRAEFEREINRHARATERAHAVQNRRPSDKYL